MMYEYKAEFVRVIDGDTIVFNIDLGFNTWIRNESVRLAFINAPEVRTRNLEEKKHGFLATDFVQEEIERCIRAGGYFTLKTHKYSDSFGRFVAEVFINYPYVEPVNLNDLIVIEGHAVYQDY